MGRGRKKGGAGAGAVTVAQTTTNIFDPASIVGPAKKLLDVNNRFIDAIASFSTTTGNDMGAANREQVRIVIERARLMELAPLSKEIADMEAEKRRAIRQGTNLDVINAALDDAYARFNGRWSEPVSQQEQADAVRYINGVYRLMQNSSIQGRDQLSQALSLDKSKWREYELDPKGFAQFIRESVRLAREKPAKRETTRAERSGVKFGKAVADAITTNANQIGEIANAGLRSGGLNRVADQLASAIAERMRIREMQPIGVTLDRLNGQISRLEQQIQSAGTFDRPRLVTQRDRARAAYSRAARDFERLRLGELSNPEISEARRRVGIVSEMIQNGRLRGADIVRELTSQYPTFYESGTRPPQQAPAPTASKPRGTRPPRSRLL